MIPQYLSAREIDDLIRPLVTSAIAFRLGTATSEHYHELAGALVLAVSCAKTTQRNQHLLAELDPAGKALNDIFDRGDWRATADESFEMEASAEIYRAILRTTPRKKISKAMRAALKELDQRFS